MMNRDRGLGTRADACPGARGWGLGRVALTLAIVTLSLTPTPTQTQSPWREAAAGYQFAFPRDHASHPDYKIAFTRMR